MKQMKLSIFCLPVFLMMGFGAFASYGDSTRAPRWYVPHYVPVQLAGNIGLFSTGAAYASKNGNYELAVLYGYVPASVAQTTIHTVGVKNIFPLMRLALKNNQEIIPYLGLGLTLEVGANSFFRIPDHFPDSYYDLPKNAHVIGYGGMKLRHLFHDHAPLLRGVEFYIEAGTVDVYLWYKTISSQIKFNEVFSVALGLNLLLNR